MNPTTYAMLADLVVVAHLSFVLVVVSGPVLTLIGRFARWGWVRSFWVRLVHFLMLAVVVVQALAGVVCPLTTLEKDLRIRAGSETYSGSFIGHWAHELLFVDFEESTLTLIYCLFGVLVLTTFWLVPPRWPWTRRSSSADPSNDGANGAY